MASWIVRYKYAYSLIIIICACICAICFIAQPSRTHALADPITTNTPITSVNFPKSLDFEVTAQDGASPITQATIFIAFESIGRNQEQHLVSVAAPSTTVTFHWHEVISSKNFTPSGTQVSYYWIIADSNGTTHATQQKTFPVLDTRFPWQHLNQGLVQVNWYGQPEDFGKAILKQASSDLQRSSTWLGGSLQQPIQIWIYQNIQDFHSSLAPDTHEWVGGVALPRLNECSIVIGSLADDTVTRDMPHELTHLVFHQLTAHGIPAPTWFDEGLAVYNQQYHEPDMIHRLKNALTTHSLLRLNDITQGFPSNADKAYLAYAESWNLVDYMYRTYGHAKMAELIKDMNQPGIEFNQALQQALKIDQAHLENQWRLQLNQPATLTSAQEATTQQSSPQTFLGPMDTLSFQLLGLGLLLVLISLSSLGGLYFYWKRYHTQNKQIV